ncbi:hypothetical protein I4U23_005607 [Adineta vaga]|nr:hypothetical protein I4U23_005607 [Adineta vaga]
MFTLTASIIVAIIYVGLAISKLVLYSQTLHRDCFVETQVITYLLYGGLVDLGWIVLCIISPCCGFNPTTYLVTTQTRQGGRVINEQVDKKTAESKDLGNHMLLGAVACFLGSFVFWCLGNAWVLNKYQYADFYDVTSSNYCDSTLFKGAFGIVISADVWIALFVFTIIFIWCKK